MKKTSHLENNVQLFSFLKTSKTDTIQGVIIRPEIKRLYGRLPSTSEDSGPSLASAQAQPGLILIFAV